MAISFQTNFAFDWDQVTDGITDAAVGTTGDLIKGNGSGLTAPGGGPTSAGLGDFVISSGGFGPGSGFFRHRVGHGVNNGGGGLFIGAWSDLETMHVRYYTRFQSGFDYSGSNKYMKQLYLQNAITSLPGRSYWGLHECLWGGHIQSEGVNRQSSVYWCTTNGGTHPNGTGDGEWHLVEWKFVMNTPDVADGEVAMWLDETQIINETGCDYQRATDFHPTVGFQSFQFGENHSTIDCTNAPTEQGSTWFVDFSDLVVADSYIGPLASDVSAKQRRSVSMSYFK